jgi:beta-glucosidase
LKLKLETELKPSSTICKPLAVVTLAFALAGCEQQAAEQSMPVPAQPEATTQAAVDAWPLVQSPFANDPAIENRVTALLAKMSVEEKVGQIMQAEIRHASPQDVKDYHLGSILNGGGSFPKQDKYATAGDWLELADAYYDASMDSSDGHLAIPVLWGTDAVHGHSNVIGATIFPHNIGLGAMHNPSLVREIGRATAREVLSTGIDWTFAPTVAVTQDDRWGRSYESYSEDPSLVKAYATEMVYGLQGVPGTPEFLDSEHVLATAKHFLGDGGTEAGDDQGNTRVSEEELRDIHAQGYYGAIEAGVQTVMASFSSWNGEKMHGNPYLLTDVLRGRMGFDGFVIGDWNGHGQVVGCTNASCAASFNAGLDMFMVVEDWKELYKNTLKQVRSGEISQQRLDEAVRRVLRVKIRAGVFEKGRPSERAAGLQGVLGSAEHRAVARQAVRESLVLIKNAGGLLPVQPNLKVLVTGDGADDIGKQSGGWTISWQGTGNEKSDFPGATSILDGLKEAVEAIGGSLEHSSNGDFLVKPDVAVVVFGENPYAEGQGDLPSLEFEPGDKRSLALLKKLKADGVPVVSVFLSGRPLWTNPEINASDAFVAAWLPGSEGTGVADVLVGDIDGLPRHDFKGRLSFSWLRDPSQNRLNPHHEDYSPLFALGYGLTYASGEEGPGLLEENVTGLQAATQDSIALYSGRPLPPWSVYIGEGENNPVMLSGSYAASTGGTVSASTTDMNVQEDALQVRFSGTGAGNIHISGPGLDLSGFTASGILSFQFKQDEPGSGILRLRVGHKAIDFDTAAYTLVGQGWNEVTVPLSCFADSGTSFENVTVPFRLESDDKFELSFGEIRYLKSGDGIIDCK